MRFADEQHGFAVGHGGIVLSTDDGGETWQRRLDGNGIAQIMLVEAKRSGDDGQIRLAQRFVDEGLDKPLLDALVLDPSRIIVVGAFGIALYSDDGGHSWSSWKTRLNNPSELHLNAIRARGARIVVAGEQGLVRLSEDGGATFAIVTTPYKGSYFSLELDAPDQILLAGLRGNIWRSRDFGHTWVQLTWPSAVTVTATALGANGSVVLVNQAGEVLVENNDRLRAINNQTLPQLNGVLRKHDGSLLLLGPQGAITLEVGDSK